MSQEILYTSSPQGLKRGSRGFCTVVSTAGMARNLAERLESLSGYRHQFMQHEVGENPVNYSHVCVSVGGRKYHVLSRIADAGLDYTQRTNKLAHHVALTTQEVAKAPGGPAWVLSQSGFCVEAWDGEVKTIPENRSRPTEEDRRPAPCKLWKKATDDEGWGGVLAEAVSKRGSPLSVIFNAEHNPLLLLRESLALLPKETRWDVTFSTYFTKLPAGVDCRCRFVLDGTPEASALRRDPHANLIDLCEESLGRASGGPLVEAARTGMVPKRTAIARDTAATQTSARKAVPRKLEEPPSEKPKTRRPETLPPPSRLNRDRDDPRDFPFPHEKYARSKRGLQNPKFQLAIALCLFLSGGVVGAIILGNQSAKVTIAQTPPEVAEERDEPPVEPVAEPVRVADTEPQGLSEESRQLLEEMEKENERQDSQEESLPDTETDDEETGEAMPEEETPVEPFRDAFEDLDRRNAQLSLPDRTNFAESEYTNLASLYVDDPADCDLTLVGDQIQSAGDNVRITPTESESKKLWRIKMKDAAGFDREVAEFLLQEQELKFRWQGGGLDLEHCFLDITVAGKKKRCTLSKPRLIPPFQIEFDASTYDFEFPITVKDFESLRIDVWLSGGVFRDGSEKWEELRPGEKATFQVPHEKSLGQNKFVEITAELADNGRKPLMRLSASVFALLLRDEYVRLEDVERVARRIQAPLPISEKKESASFPILDDGIRQCERMDKDLKLFRKTNRVKERKYIRDRSKAAEALSELEKKWADLVRDREGPLTPVEEGRRDRQLEAAQAEIDNLDKDLAFVQSVFDVIERIQAFVDSNKQWCHDTERLLETIHADVRVHFRLYKTIDGHQLDLVRTE